MRKLYHYLPLAWLALFVGCKDYNVQRDNILSETNLFPSQVYSVASTSSTPLGLTSKEKKWTRGDFNNDGMGDIKDVIAIMRYHVFGDEAPFYAHAVDMNLDQKIDYQDALILSERLFNPDKYEEWVNKIREDFSHSIIH